MSIMRKSAVAAAAAAALWAGVAIPAGASTTDPQAPAGDGWIRVTSEELSTKVWNCHWEQTESWGSTKGCATPHKAEGWVKDLKADGYCVQIAIHWKGKNGESDWDYSPEACPEGDKDEFTKAPGDGSHWTAAGRDVWFKKV